MNSSTINIEVVLDDQRVPEGITWVASDSDVPQAQQAKAFILSFWDGSARTALRMDLWTKDMRVDEMADFYFQTLMTMADSFDRATHAKELTENLKAFASSFYKKFQQLQASDPAQK